MLTTQVLVAVIIGCVGLLLAVAGILVRNRGGATVTRCAQSPDAGGNPSNVWRLVPTAGNQWVRDEIVLARGSYVLGRSKRCDVVLDCRFVSREHACIRVAGGWASVSGQEGHSPVYVRCAGGSKFRKLRSDEGFQFDTGDLVSFNSPEAGMVFQVLPASSDGQMTTRS